MRLDQLLRIVVPENVPITEPRLSDKIVASPLLLTASEVASELRLSPRQLHRYRLTGQVLQPIKVGGGLRWRR